MGLLVDSLKSSMFSVVTDRRVYRNQEFLSLEDGVLVTKSLVKIPLADVRFFFFSSRPKFSRRGRSGKFVPLRFTRNGRSKTVEGRILSENSKWVLAEVGSIPFLIRKI